MTLQKQIMSSKLIIILLLLGFFPPGYLCHIPVINLVMNALQIAGFLLIAVLFISDIRKHLKKPFNILLIALWAELLLSTLLSKYASPYTYATNVIPVLGACFLAAEIAIHNPYTGLKSMYIFFSACVLINTATYFLYPNAMYEIAGARVCWFLGDDNTGYSYYILASTLAMIYCKYIKGKVTAVSILVWIFGYIFAFGREIGSGRICQIVWSLLFLIYHFKWIKKVIKVRYVLYVAVGGFLVLVIFRSAIIEPIALAVGKSITLTGRTIVWDNVLKAVSQRLLLGFGICIDETFTRLVYTTLWGAHNYILQLLFWGGICAVVLFALLIFFGCKGPKTVHQSNYCKCLIIGLIVVLIRLLVENGASAQLYLLLTMLAYSAETVLGLQRDILKRKTTIRFSRAVTTNART